MSPEEKKMLANLIKYRNTYCNDMLQNTNKLMHATEKARFLGQAQGMKILVDMMMIHYKTKEGQLNEHTTK